MESIDTIKETKEIEVKTCKVVSPWMGPLNHITGKEFKDGALDYLDSLNRFYIYRNIQIFDKLFDCPRITDHCLTIRNRSYQQIYLVGTAGNRKPRTIFPFCFRVIDQYNRLAILIKKHFKNCFKEQVIDIECPPGLKVAKMVKNKVQKHSQLFTIFEPKEMKTKFIIARSEDKRNQNEFKVLSSNRQTIASISKRYERFTDSDKSLLYEDHYIRIIIEGDSQAIDSTDKAVILSSALILVSHR